MGESDKEILGDSLEPGEVLLHSSVPTMKPIPLDRFDLRILHALRRINREITIYSRKLAVKAELTFTQVLCLQAIRDVGKTTASQIARSVSLSPSTVVGILDRLEELNLIVRERDKRDRRLVQICLTENGELTLRSARSPILENLVKVLTPLSMENQAAIALPLEKVADLMELRQMFNPADYFSAGVP